MSEKTYLESFAYYFKRYRFKANISTLRQFADLMAAEGLYYDVSNYTRWQNGERIPNDRKILLGMIRVFIDKNAISTVEDCNIFLHAAKQLPLKKGEISNLQVFKESIRNMLPIVLDDFVGREDFLKDINWRLITYNKICITGTAGIGKTSFVIYLAYLLQKTFQEGVFYFRVDIQYIDTILLDIARFYGEDVSTIKGLNDRLIFVMSILKSKKTVIILDNIDNYKNIDSLIKSLDGYCKFILVSQYSPPLYRDSYHFNLSGFSETETLQLAEHKLGEEYVRNNRAEILEVAKLSGYSPLALDIMFSYLDTQRINAKELLEKIDNIMLPITYQSTYDNKTVASSIEISLSTLENNEKKVVSSLSMFEGTDISISALRSIHNIREEEIRKILARLIDLSLIERSKTDRVRIHPLVRTYLRQKVVSYKWYLLLTKYYLHLNNFEYELDNIRGVMQYLSLNKQSNSLVSLWNKVAVSLLEEGRYEDIKTYKDMLQNIAYRDTLPTIILILITLIYLLAGFFVLVNPNHSKFFSMIYWPIASYGLIYGYVIYRKWRGFSSLIGRSIFLFILGLTCQVLGQILYSILTIMESNITPYPYPSIGDIAYFGSIPMYIIATILLGQAIGIKITLRSLSSKIQSVLIPIFILTASYTVFLKDYYFDFSNIPKIILDFGYPLGQSIYLSFIILIFVLSQQYLLPILRKGIFLIMIALAIQFTADFIFLYRFSHNMWNISGDFGDLIYLLAYATMGFALLQFDYTYKLKKLNNTDLFTKVKKYIFSTS